MAFPNASEISNAAATLGVDPLEVYAYAAIHGRVPTDVSGPQALGQSARQLAQAALGSAGYQPVDQLTMIALGYMQAKGSQPYTWWSDVDPWGVANGFLKPPPGDLGLRLTGAEPFGGYGYPPGNQATDAMPSTGSTTPAPAPGLFSGLQLDGKTILIGGVALGGLYYVFGRRR